MYKSINVYMFTYRLVIETCRWNTDEIACMYSAAIYIHTFSKIDRHDEELQSVYWIHWTCTQMLQAVNGQILLPNRPFVWVKILHLHGYIIRIDIIHALCMNTDWYIDVYCRASHTGDTVRVECLGWGCNIVVPLVIAEAYCTRKQRHFQAVSCNCKENIRHRRLIRKYRLAFLVMHYHYHSLFVLQNTVYLDHWSFSILPNHRICVGTRKPTYRVCFTVFFSKMLGEQHCKYWCCWLFRCQRPRYWGCFLVTWLCANYHHKHWYSCNLSALPPFQFPHASTKNTVIYDVLPTEPRNEKKIKNVQQAVDHILISSCTSRQWLCISYYINLYYVYMYYIYVLYILLYIYLHYIIYIYIYYIYIYIIYYTYYILYILYYIYILYILYYIYYYIYILYFLLYIYPISIGYPNFVLS